MEEKGNFCLMEQSQLINMEGMMKVENCHMATIMVIIDSSKNHSFLLKLNGKNLRSKSIFTVLLKSISSRENDLVSYKGKSNFPTKTLDRHHFNQGAKLTPQLMRPVDTI